MILAAGCFDGLSAPQVRYLQACRRVDSQQRLVVTLVPDRYILQHKGRYPYWPQADRAHVVYALDCVDDIVLQADDETVPDVIRRLRPKIFAKGPDWQGRLDRAHVDACEAVGATIHFTPSFGRHWSDVR